MLITFIGPDDPLESAFYNSMTGGADLEPISLSATELVLRNPSNGVVSTFTGFGLPTDPEMFAGLIDLPGTVTGWSSTTSTGQTIVTVQNIVWSAGAMVAAVIDLIEGEDSTAFMALMSLQPVTFDASGAVAGAEMRFDGATSPFNIITSPGWDFIGGGEINDTILVTANQGYVYDAIFGSAGDDVITFQPVTNTDGGVDLIYEYLLGPITVNLDGAANLASVFKQGRGTDTLHGVQNVLGEANLDFTIYGSTGSDTFNINGGAGNRVSIVGGEGADIYNLTLSGDVELNLQWSWDFNSLQGADVNLASGQILNDGFGHSETLNITQAGGSLELRTGWYDDHIVGSAWGESLRVNEGNDTVDAGGGNDTVRGGDGDDDLQGGGGDDLFWDGDGDDIYRGGLGQDQINFTGSLGATTFGLTSFGGQLVVSAGWGNATVYSDVERLVFGPDFDFETLSYAEAVALVEGMTVYRGSTVGNAMAAGSEAAVYLGFEGDDWITPGAGSDTVDGGDGTDMVSFFDALSRAVIDLALGTAVIGAETDVLQNIENITGTIFGDLITGDAGANRIRALGDYDWLVGSGGGDLFEGGTGRDTVAYSSAAAGVTASLLSDTGTAGQANGDRYIDVENLTGGSFADRLTGDADRNILRGLGGDDFLFGLAGADTIDGGAGRDSIDGGLGNDRMTGGRGNDTADGGANWDVAVYSGTRAQYTVTRNAAGSISVLHNGGGVDGVDLLFNTEALQFSDGLMFL